MPKRNFAEAQPVSPAPADMITAGATDKNVTTNAPPRYSLKEIANIGELILKDPEEAIIQLLGDEKDLNCWRIFQKQIQTIPQQIIGRFQHIYFYNWMVDANKLIDDPNTKLYHELPNYLHLLAESMNFPFGNIDIKDLKTVSLIFSLPPKSLRMAFSPGYFEKNPSLYLIKRNKKTGVMTTYLLSIGFANPAESRIHGPPRNVKFGTLCANKTDVHASFTPVFLRESHMQMLDLQTDPDEGVVMSTLDYNKRFKTGIPTLDSSTKQMQQNIRHLTPCEIAKQVFRPEPILISVQEN